METYVLERLCVLFFLLILIVTNCCTNYSLTLDHGCIMAFSLFFDITIPMCILECFYASYIFVYICIYRDDPLCSFICIVRSYVMCPSFVEGCKLRICFVDPPD